MAPPAIPEISINRARLAQLLRKMVNIYSPSGKEGDLVDFLEGWMKRRGLPVMRQKVDEDRDNLIIEPDDTDPTLVFVGHLDTVEAFDLDRYSYERDGDIISGLGTADMKGGCAAMIEAFVSLWEQGQRDLPVALALVVGEEDTGDGAQRLVREYQFSNAIVGEPTGLQPCLAHHGYLEIHLVTEGTRMHASMAPRAKRAVDGMLHLLLAFIARIEEDHPEVIYNIRNLSSTDVGFATADRCEAFLDLHLPPRSPLGEITQSFEDLVRREQEQRDLPNATIKFLTIDAGYELPVRGGLAQTLRDLYQERGRVFEPGSFRSHSDANQLWNAGIRPVVLGPGDLSVAHTSEESVSFQEVAAAAEIYANLAVRQT
ncbi:MAG: M20/M25/M40 family metallo-hydrolase [Pseudomonadota bacterium]